MKSTLSNPPLKKRTTRSFHTIVLLTAIVMAAGFFLASYDSGYSREEAPKQDTGAGKVSWNLLAVTDPGHLDTVEKINAMEWSEWTQIKAFYPNQATYQWLSGREGPSGYHENAEEVHRMGSQTITDTVACVSCHYEGGYEHPWQSETDLGVQSGYDKPTDLEINVRAAYDEQRYYVWVRWDSDTDASGRGLADAEGPMITHQTYRYDGSGFDSQGTGRVAGPEDIEIDHVDQLEPGERFNSEDRITMMSVPAAANLKDPVGASFNAHGCFMACHSDMRNMPDDLEKVQEYEFTEDPILGEAGMDVSDLRHYILLGRNVDENSSAGEIYGPQFPEGVDSFEQYLTDFVLPDLEEGKYIDLWQARMGRSVPMGHASADFVHPYRLHNNQLIDINDGWADSGVQNWFNNRPDPDAGDHMAWIYDAEKTGYWAIYEDELAEKMRSGHGPLITEGKDQNALNLADDARFEWDEDEKDFRLTRDARYNGETIARKGDLLGRDLLREGDLIPRRALQQTKGARGVVQAFANWNDGTYDVVFVRDREVDIDGGKTTDHTFDPDSGHTVGFSVFDDHTGNRSHYVTFPVGIIARTAGKEAYHAHPGVHANTPVILAESN